jgi:hypothetical protein
MSELAELRYSNGNVTARNLFIQNHRFVTLMPNYKAKADFLRQKRVPRFAIQGPLNLAITHFLIYIRLVQIFFSKCLDTPGQNMLSIYVFGSWDASTHWTGSYLYTQFKV